MSIGTAVSGFPSGSRGLRNLAAAAAVAVLVLVAGRRPALAGVTGTTYNPATGHWYKLITGPQGTWSAAKSAASGLGGYLAGINSSAEKDWVLQNMNVGTISIWLGGTDESFEGTWAWQNSEAWGYTNWNPGEPNNSGNEDYLMMYSSGTWNDANSTYTLPGYLVEWDTDPNPPPPPTTPAAPTNLAASLSFQSTILLTWTDNSDNEQTFQVERKASGGSYGRIATMNAGATAFEDTDLAPLVDYSYRVRAVNLVGPSAYSNEAAIVSGTYVPAPVAPSDLVVTGTSPSTVDLQWTDNSDGETGFEVQRRVGSGAYAYLATTGPDVTTFQDTGLSPDASYGYQVRSVGTLRPSGFVEAAGATDPSLTVDTVKGDLKDSTKPGKDSIKLTAIYDFLPGVSDGTADPVSEGITVKVGDPASPVNLTISPGDETWKGKGAKKTWKSPKGTAGKYKVQVDTTTRTVTVTISGIQLPVAAAATVRVSVAVGNDAGTETKDWPAQKKAGTFKYR